MMPDHREQDKEQELFAKAMEGVRYAKTYGMFHLQDNFYFERKEDGRVHIHVEDGLKVCEVTVSADAWCSVVAAVSKRGDTAAVYAECLETHNKENDQ